MYKAKKRFGQHFLNDNEILKAIVQNADLQENDIVWEIGPGLGALTDHLLNHHVNLTIFEIDNDLVPNLRSKYSDKCVIVHDDVLRVDWKACLPPLPLIKEGEVKIVTNLPYQISSPFLYKLTEHHKMFHSIVVMLQKEVAKRLCALPGKKEYGVLTLKTKFYFDTEYLFEVSRNKFTPPPEVESAVIKLVPRKDIPEIENIKLFWNIVETAFRSRRKTLRNNLKGMMDIKHLSNSTIHEGDLNIDLNRRGETLSEEEFITLYNFIFQFVNG